MRIAIDTRLNSYRTGGIPHYTSQLLAAMIALAPGDQFITIAHRKPPRESLVYGSSITRRRVWTPPHHRWEQMLLPLELRRLRADVIHFPDVIPLFRLRAPTVITVHDLAFLRYPHILDQSARRFYGQIRRAVARADAIIAVSESTRRDLADLLAVDPARVDVVYEAAAAHFQPLKLQSDATRTIQGQSLRANTFALFVGTVEPRKNLATLIQALGIVRERRDLDPPPLLVIAGARGWLDDDVFALVKRLRLADAVRFVGNVGVHDLVWLYNACRVYLHPELYSGFGLPVLEAMQCGAPTIVADTSSLPEVAGDASLLIPPEDVAAWAEAWRNVWQDGDLRNRLRDAGRQQAAKFTWDTAAQATLQIYRRIVREH